MKKLLTILLIFTLIGCSSLKYLDAFDEYHGMPKYVLEESFKVVYENGKYSEKKSLGHKYVYDIRGRRTESITINSKGEAGSVVKYFYDKKGNVSKFVSFRRNGEKGVEIIYEYNKYGHQIKNEYIHGYKSVTITKYDRKNKKASLFVKKDKEKGEFKENALFFLDEKWRRKEVIYKNEEGKFNGRSEYFYNDIKDQKTTKRYNRLNKLIEIYTLTFNDRKEHIKREKYRIIENKKKLVEENSYEYRYDYKGNWIEKKIYTKGKLTMIQRNRIEYY